jgi:hypothetical protein
MLGAEEIISIDASSYEGASFIHDMNQPIPDKLKNRFTAVIDGGSLEHIFDFPTAIKNCMEMVQIGGHFVTINNANNFMGHGFYQFSPELYYRVLSKDNGFDIERVLIFEAMQLSKWYEAIDPQEVQKRVELVNNRPTHIFVQARKIDSVPIFSSPPQQSDYVAIWEKHTALSGDRVTKETKGMIDRIKETAPRLLNMYRIIRAATRPRPNPEFFKEVK